jgi:hypothetical protein
MKKVPRLLTMVLSLSLFGAATVAASSMWGDYEGFAKARVLINNEEAAFSDGAPAFLIKGSTVFPVRTLSESLHALVKWDNSAKTISIFKPNVHMFVAKKVNDDYSIKQPFGGVKKGDRLDFAVFAQVDSLETPFHSFKISIETPSGDEAVTAHEKVVGGQKENFWYPWPFSVTFSEAGKYKVKFAIKLSEGSDYVVVSEKAILSE